MNKKLVHTPEGVRDIYGDEEEKKLRVERLLSEKIHAYGCRDIQTPTFEFFDVFSKEVGTTPSRELYKFFDKEGNTLVLRPDFTPSIARCAAKYFMDEEIPLRLCYQGNTFTNTSNLQGKLKEVTQMGVELIGDDSVYADAEMIAMVIEALYHAEALLADKKVREKDKAVLLKTSDLFGSTEALEEAGKAVNNDRSFKAVERLKQVYKVLCDYGVEKYVSFDLTMLSKYNYYTGIIFKGYTYGVGDTIVKGGRYDNLLGRFGKEAPAIGFMIAVDDLLLAMERQNVLTAHGTKRIQLYYREENFRERLKEARMLRTEGKAVELLPEKKRREKGR